MMLSLTLAAALAPPNFPPPTLAGADPAPLRAALDRCDRVGMAALTTAEPRRRASFAGAAYDEQRAIAEDRAQLDAAALAADPAAALAATGARAALETRQRRLDDARAVERAWRETLEENRLAFLAQCTSRRDSPERQP